MLKYAIFSRCSFRRAGNVLVFCTLCTGGSFSSFLDFCLLHDSSDCTGQLNVTLALCFCDRKIKKTLDIVIQLDIRIEKICDPGLVFFFKHNKLVFSKSRYYIHRGLNSSFFLKQNVSEGNRLSEGNIHILPVSKLCRATSAAEMMPELCCWFSEFLCSQSIPPRLRIGIFGSQGLLGGGGAGGGGWWSFLGTINFALPRNWVLKCNCDSMCWLHAWICHLQNQTSGCSVLKMQPHYPLL